MLVFAILGDFYKGRHFVTSMSVNSCNPWCTLVYFNGITRYLLGLEAIFFLNANRTTTILGFLDVCRTSTIFELFKEPVGQ